MFVLYLITFEYFNVKTRENLKNNSKTQTSLYTLNDELSKKNCNDSKIYCTNDSDCLQICANAIDIELQTQYKCSTINICTQSLLNSDNSDNQSLNKKSCNKDFGFFPVLTSDEIFQSHWTCINTRPSIFNDQQQYHQYICSGGNKDNLDHRDLFNSCKCPNTKIKVRDEFRTDIPLCIDKHQLSLFPNFTRETTN